MSIPLKQGNELGDSMKMALARFLSMERKFQNNPVLKDRFCEFMREYLELGHMIASDNPNNSLYYMPPQAVVRKASTTTKLRVVFDASAKTSNGKSLNEVMLVGPRLQKDIVDILCKWRT